MGRIRQQRLRSGLLSVFDFEIEETSAFQSVPAGS